MQNSTQSSFNHLMGLAQRSHQKGDLPMAINLYKEALKVIPRQPDALQYLGIAYCSQQKYNEGIRYLEKAVEVQPENPVLLTNLSNAYLKVEAHVKALPLLQKSVQLKPDFDEAWHKLANVYKAVDRVDEAIQAYNKAIALNPQHFNAYYNLGNAMTSLGNYKTALSLYEKCVDIKPDFALGHNNLGVVLLEWDRMEEAEQHYLKAIQINPTLKEGIKNLYQLYERIGKENQAKKWGAELLTQNPTNSALKFHLDTKAPIICEHNDEIDQYRNHLNQQLVQAFANKPTELDSFIEYDNYPSSELTYQGRFDKEIKEKYASFYSEIPTVNVSHQNDKCHVGFIVTQGHEGVFLKCMRGVLNTIDTEKLDVSVVCSYPNGAKIIQPAITNPAIKFVVISKDFKKAQAEIVNAKIDILHYWEIGTDSANYFLALTKPAKVQVTSWGWPTTSGLASMDYFISQKNLETRTSSDQYTEQLVLFDKIPTYYYRPPVPQSAKTIVEYGLPEGKPLYLCQQNLRKVHPDFDVIITEILRKDKEAIVVFICDKQKGITEKLKQRISKATNNNTRVVFLGRMSEAGYLGLLKQCHVVLDTLHYGGGANTVYDSIEAGTPVVTLEGQKHSARFASAALKQLRVIDTITHSITEYVEKAVSIANDSVLRESIVTRMKQNDHHIFEDNEAIKELEAFCIEKYNQHCC